MQLGAQDAVPVREFNTGRGTYAFRGVIVYLMLSIRCACAPTEPGVIVSCCACALHCPPPVAGAMYLRRRSPCISHFLSQSAVPVGGMGQQDWNPLCRCVGCVFEFVGLNF